MTVPVFRKHFHYRCRETVGALSCRRHPDLTTVLCSSSFFENTSISVCRNGLSAFMPPTTRISCQRYGPATRWAPFMRAVDPDPCPPVRRYAFMFLLFGRQAGYCPQPASPDTCCLPPATPFTAGGGRLGEGEGRQSPGVVPSTWSVRAGEGSRIVDSSLAPPTLQLQDNEKM